MLACGMSVRDFLIGVTGDKTHPECRRHSFMSWALDWRKVEELIVAPIPGATDSCLSGLKACSIGQNSCVVLKSVNHLLLVRS